MTIEYVILCEVVNLKTELTWLRVLIHDRNSSSGCIIAIIICIFLFSHPVLFSVVILPEVICFLFIHVHK